MPSYSLNTKVKTANKYWNSYHKINKSTLSSQVGCSIGTLNRWIKKYKPEYTRLRQIGGKSKVDKLHLSLKEFLSDEKSKGPNAKKGVIDYHYQRYENVYSYFVTLLSEQKFRDILCIPNIILKFENFIDRTAMAFRPHDGKIYIAPSTKKAISKQKCINKRFLFFMLILLPEKGTLTHANILIIDTKKKTLERFEPYGGLKNKNQKKIDNMFEKYGLDKLGIKELGFKYISPVELSPKFGIQSKADSYNGMCITISMLYFQLRLLNPNIPQKELIKDLMKLSTKDLKSLILKFAKHVESTLKLNSKLVLELQNQLIKAYYQDGGSSFTLNNFKKKYKLFL